MGKLQNFYITLQNNAVYYAGQTVEGIVHVSLNEPMKIRELRLTLDGSANVRWTEEHDGDACIYSCHENYIKVKFTVYNPEQQGSEYHPQGTFQYPFSFRLPPSLPSSFEGIHGNVRYYVKGTMDRPWRFDHNCKQMFTVVANFDLNQMPHLINNCETRNSKTLCCLCCQSGPISALMRLNRTGFVPGENIMINAECDNQSNRTMNASYVELRQFVTFKAPSKQRTISKPIVQVRRGEIAPGESEVYMNQPLPLPPLPPSNLFSCNIIDIRYVLTLTVDPSGPGFDLDAPVKLVVGTIPYRNIQASFCTVLPNMPSAPAIEPPPDGMQVPPLSYAECVFGKVDVHDDEDNEYTRGEMSWAPTYPFYSWANPQQGQEPPPPVMPPNVPSWKDSSGMEQPYAPPPAGTALPYALPTAGMAQPYAPPPTSMAQPYAPPPAGMTQHYTPPTKDMSQI